MYLHTHINMYYRGTRREPWVWGNLLFPFWKMFRLVIHKYQTCLKVCNYDWMHHNLIVIIFFFNISTYNNFHMHFKCVIGQLGGESGGG
jgi:hypothetical protein